MLVAPCTKSQRLTRNYVLDLQAETMLTFVPGTYLYCLLLSVNANTKRYKGQRNDPPRLHQTQPVAATAPPQPSCSASQSVTARQHK